MVRLLLRLLLTPTMLCGLLGRICRVRMGGRLLLIRSSRLGVS